MARQTSATALQLFTCLALALALALAPQSASHPIDTHAQELISLRKKYPLYDVDPKWCPNTIVRQKIVPSMAGSCRGVKIPPTLCTGCRLRPFNATGFFQDNRDIYKIEEKECLDGMKEYVKLNPCDEPRVKQVPIFAAGVARGNGLNGAEWKARKQLGEFMYNTCELCCDCIPWGARKSQYKQREAVYKWTGNESTLMHAYRGNCPVHYYYDTCRMWPNITDVARPNEKLNTNQSQICRDHVYPWWDSPEKFRENWLMNPKAKIPDWRFVNFLVKMTNILNCKNETLWKECVGLERAQMRI